MRELAMCRQWDPTSCLEFREARPGFLMMKNFSLQQSMQLLVAGSKGAPLSKIFQASVYVDPLLLISQMWVLSTVSCLYLSCLKDLLWFPSLDFQSVPVHPT